MPDVIGLEAYRLPRDGTFHMAIHISEHYGVMGKTEPWNAFQDRLRYLGFHPPLATGDCSELEEFAMLHGLRRWLGE